MSKTKEQKQAIRLEVIKRLDDMTSEYLQDLSISEISVLDNAQLFIKLMYEHKEREDEQED